eukprot:CAMPEP_0172813522 /NCGR_PEP_ID=MMETSP1075-20121228/10713_1 /TAXON_ID=2916 /ORGANISM="Ceratium fusus, Strain PA161109" /LENGTH=342 /DNA_ID=CAMNT_0013653233 /DNA_START=64 /DNA_END=1089 /DNA_ORIENTATION=+
MGRNEPLLDQSQVSHGTSILKCSWLGIFLLGTLGSEICVKHVQLAAAKYPMALVFLMGLTGLIAYPVVVVAALTFGKMHCKQMMVEWYKPAMVGICFVLHDMLLKVGGRGALPGPLILVCVKAVVPFSMVMSMSARTLNYSYTIPHWAGMIILMVGILVTGLNQLNHFGHQNHATFVQGISQAMCIVASTIPLAASFVFLEKWLKGNPNMFPVAFWMWACLFMLPVTLLMVPAGAALAGVPFSNMWVNLADGISCYAMGTNPKSEPGETVDCPTACTFWWIWLVFAFACNVAMPMSTRHGSATLLWFVRSIAVPLGAMLFASHQLMGSAAVPMDVFDCIGLA